MKKQSRQIPAMASRKSQEDLEVEARIRGHLRHYMARRGVTQTELARRIGTDDGNIVRLLNGSRGFGPGLILRISRKLSIDPGTLLEEEPPEEYRQDPLPKNSATQGARGKK